MSRLANGGNNISLKNRPADKADAPGDSGSSGAPAEAANYKLEHRAKVGQTGSWESLGLPSLREIAPDEPRSEGKTRLAAAPLAVQLAPFGEFNGVLNKTDGTKTPIVQHLDRAAFRAMNPSFNRNIFLGHASKHFSGKEKHLKNNIPLRPADYDLMPTA